MSENMKPEIQNYIIVSHSNRTKTVLKKIEKTINQVVPRVKILGDYEPNSELKSFSIGNCGIILITIKPEETGFTIDAIILDKGNREDNLESKSEVIYHRNLTVSDSKDRTNIEKRYDLLEKLLPPREPVPNESLEGRISKHRGKKYNFFIVRHGQGVHNYKKTLNAISEDMQTKITNMNRPDPELTPLGISQSRQAGEILKKYFDKENYDRATVTYYVSTLLRTHQTLLYFLSNFLVDSYNTEDTVISAIVLPNNGEISDSWAPSRENEPLCANKDSLPRCKSISMPIDNTVNHLFAISLDWKYLEPNVNSEDINISLAFKIKQELNKNNISDQDIIDISKQPLGQPAAQPAAQPLGQPEAQLAAQPAAQPAAQLAAQPAAKPAAQPAAQPVAPTQTNENITFIKDILNKMFTTTKITGGRHRTNCRRQMEKYNKTMKKGKRSKTIKKSFHKK
uniref:Uncharacterized protein n=1 Tax=viral metagenome TaxID=1070528 RepID=A0A6C0D391_9ZZZZ